MSNQTDNNGKLNALLGKAGRHEPADDFEKEALEGFSTLGNNPEALKLKQELDARIYPEVFSGKKNNRAYWLAAAGLFLVIGFSVYFIMNSTGPKELAVTTVPKQEEVLPALPPVTETPQKENPPAKKAAAISFKEQKPEPPAEPKPSSQSQPVLTSAVLPAAPLQKNKKEKSMVLPLAPAITSADAGSQESTVTTLAKKDAAEEAQDDKNSMAKEAEINAPAVASTASRAQTFAYNGALAPATSKVAMPGCFYTGGDAALQKDLQQKLTAKNSAGKFDAVLFINSNNTVEKAELTKTYALTKEQQLQVLDVLKSLGKFNVAGTGTAKYTLQFRP